MRWFVDGFGTWCGFEDEIHAVCKYAWETGTEMKKNRARRRRATLGCRDAEHLTHPKSATKAKSKLTPRNIELEICVEL